MLRYVLSTFPTMPPSVVMQRKRAAFIVQKLIDEVRARPVPMSAPVAPADH